MPSDAEDLAARLDRIKRLTDEYLAVKGQSSKVRELAERIRQEIEGANKQVTRPITRR